MCGIFCLITKDGSKTLCLADLLKEQLAKRGPDFQASKVWTIKDIHLYFSASILWMQGEEMMVQPIENKESIFLYNGNIYGGLPENDSMKFGDTPMLLSVIEKADNISEALLNIQGPYSFIYYDKIKNKLYFGRDHFGRISLLLGKNNETFVLTSVAKKQLNFNFIELPSVGIFCWDLLSDKITLFAFRHRSQNFVEKIQELETFMERNIIFEVHVEKNTPTRIFEPHVSQKELMFRIKNLNSEEAFKLLLSDPNWQKNVLRLQYLLELSVKKRIHTQPKFCQNCLMDKLNCHHSLFGILFSGGIDCALLAVISDNVTDKSQPIDLINVAFNENDHFQSPDRQTGHQTLRELRNVCPDRDWRFLEINVSRKELDEKRKSHISHLIFPLKTVLDDSLGCALWFAGKGSTGNSTSPSRVLLAGMGADELFGGYTKHRAAFKRGSWQALEEALNVDWQNLPHRNLARDNRVICDHGKELRTPYLDENVVEFVRSLPVWEKTCPSDEFPQGFGDKLLLRTLAYHLGLKEACFYKKRALQFGSRIANKKENAHEISYRLLE